jgi:DNA-binding response OmpR family regulator
VARILIVDDDMHLRRYLALVLEEAGHEVLQAEHGRAGLHVARHHPVDLLLCDVYMPEQDGLQTIRELRREFPGLPVVAMSGGGPEGMIDMLPIARRLGAADTLAKPFSSEALRAAVEGVLTGSDSGMTR